MTGLQVMTECRMAIGTAGGEGAMLGSIPFVLAASICSITSETAAPTMETAGEIGTVDDRLKNPESRFNAVRKLELTLAAASLFCTVIGTLPTGTALSEGLTVVVLPVPSSIGEACCASVDATTSLL